jgi:hypothetical protein
VILNTGERPDSANHSLVQHGSLLTGKKGESHAKGYARWRGLIRWQFDYDSSPGEILDRKNLARESTEQCNFPSATARVEGVVAEEAVAVDRARAYRPHCRRPRLPSKSE